MSEIEGGMSQREIEKRVRAWIATLALDYDRVLAMHDGMTSIFTPQEREKMGVEQSQELEALVKFMIDDRVQKAGDVLSSVVAGFEQGTESTELLVGASIEQLGLKLVSVEEYKLLRRSVLRNMRFLIKSIRLSQRGLPIPKEIYDWYDACDPVIVQDKQIKHLKNAGIVMSEVWTKFSESKSVGREWRKAEVDAASASMNLWISVLGDKPLEGYSPADVEQFRTIFLGLPHDYYHSSKWKGTYKTKGVRAVFELAMAVECERTTPKTWNKHLSRISELYKWAKKQGEALPAEAKSPCDGLFIHIPKKRRGRRGLTSDARRPYTKDEIQKFLNSPTFLGSRSQHRWKLPGELVFRDHRYWLVLIGLLHGTRREEPVLLKVKHVKYEHGVWHFDLLDGELAEELKSIGSPRLVPLHKYLLDLGFIEARVAGRDPEARLFPDAVSRSIRERQADPFGKWFLNFRRHCGLTDEKLDFHAFRHTVATELLNAGVPKAYVEEICGHEGEERESVLAVYDHGRLLADLKLYIDRFLPPVDVEALNAARRRSDRRDRSAAWPRLK
ncbi:site-specific integrase [Methylosinus sp. KRF6]|uniref:site-specific integrase n=1 Tax=Methylosinus sp. KRF6 TaxID=2846853 RepID=UPI001C0DE9FE|nr:site-specific integrase [Methylosinus sp. KRF6]MBU3888576.1 site-specific integrase [Methylosinus sp. KRF6]